MTAFTRAGSEAVSWSGPPHTGHVQGRLHARGSNDICGVEREGDPARYDRHGSRQGAARPRRSSGTKFQTSPGTSRALLLSVAERGRRAGRAMPRRRARGQVKRGSDNTSAACGSVLLAYGSGYENSRRGLGCRVYIPSNFSGRGAARTASRFGYGRSSGAGALWFLVLCSIIIVGDKKKSHEVSLRSASREL